MQYCKECGVGTFSLYCTKCLNAIPDISNSTKVELLNTLKKNIITNTPKRLIQKECIIGCEGSGLKLNKSYFNMNVSARALLKIRDTMQELFDTDCCNIKMVIKSVIGAKCGYCKTSTPFGADEHKAIFLQYDDIESDLELEKRLQPELESCEKLINLIMKSGFEISKETKNNV